MAGSGFRFSAGSRRTPRSFAEKLGISIFFGFFFAIGATVASVFGYIMASDLLVYRWEPAPAVIQACEVEDDREKDRPYRVAVVYEYEADGQHHTSDRFDLQQSRSDDRAEVAQLADRYPVGSETTCYVNPADSAEAVLQRPPLGERAVMAAFMLIPAVFMLVGLGGIYSVWRTPTQQADSAVSIGTPPGERSGRRGRLALIGFFTFFLLFGSIFPTIFFIVPAWRISQAQDWQPVECTITDSRVRSHYDSDSGTTYSVDVEYEYPYDGRTYRSNRYNFVGGSSSGRSGKQAVVDAHPAGSTAMAYVNPENPHEAVIDREFGGGMWIGLLTFVFPLIGLGGLVATTVAGRRAATAAGDPIGGTVRPVDDFAAGAETFAPVGGQRTSGPVTLRPQESHLGAFAFLLLFALVWNGIVYGLMVQEMGVTWLSSIFMTLGALVAVGAVYQGLRLLNPKVVMQVTSGCIPLGDRIGATWQLSRNVNRIRRLTVTLRGQEEAEYTSGTNRHTDKQTFAEYVLTERDRDRGLEIARGEVSAEVPLNAMHTFLGDHNRVVWLLHVHGDIPFWPDVNQSFEVEILPREFAHAETAP